MKGETTGERWLTADLGGLRDEMNEETKTEKNDKQTKKKQKQRSNKNLYRVSKY